MSHAPHAGLAGSHHVVIVPPAGGPPPDPYEVAPSAGSFAAASPVAKLHGAGHAPVVTAPPVAHAGAAAVPHVPHAMKHFHPMPVIGHAAAFYEKHVKQAEEAGDRHARAAHKVGMHVTSALGHEMAWPDKLKRFLHCLDRYCVCPANADDSLHGYYQKLGDLVRRYAGQEAVQLARKAHESYARRLKGGEAREAIEDDADRFFVGLLGHPHGQPDWCSREAWSAIAGWRDQWV